MYNTEKDFGKALMTKLKSEGFTCIRIESASTISGMPDLLIMGNGDDYFIELKNNKQLTLNSTKLKVPWRPGQQAWGLTYARCHTTGYIKKHSWTFMSVKDGVVLIRMDKYREDSCLSQDDSSIFTYTFNEFKDTCLHDFLVKESYVMYRQ